MQACVLSSRSIMELALRIAQCSMAIPSAMVWMRWSSSGLGILVLALKAARRSQYSASHAASVSSVLAKTPCLRLFAADADLPAAVLGPRDFLSLARAARINAVDGMLIFRFKDGMGHG